MPLTEAIVEGNERQSQAEADEEVRAEDVGEVAAVDRDPGKSADA
jgi:hypothetical protein